MSESKNDANEDKAEEITRVVTDAAISRPWGCEDKKVRSIMGSSTEFASLTNVTFRGVTYMIVVSFIYRASLLLYESVH